jgi:predicted outer membrane protein
MFEIQPSKLAQERGNAAEKSFAATMIKDHEKTTNAWQRGPAAPPRESLNTED